MGTNATALMESLQPPTQAFIAGSRTHALSGATFATSNPATGQELARISDAYRMGFVLRFICGFAPSRFLRLDPASG